MRQKYSTQAIVFGRIPTGEDSVTAILLTEDFGLVRARSQAARKHGSKMSSGLQSLSTSDVTLLRGKDGWRMAGAILDTNWARELGKDARRRAARVFELAERFIRGEHEDKEMFLLLSAFLRALENASEEDQDTIETLAVVRLLQMLGLDAGNTFGDMTDFRESVRIEARDDRLAIIARINRGIASSGL